MKKTVSILLCVCFLLGGILIGVLADSSLTTEASAASANDEIVGSWVKTGDGGINAMMQFRADGICISFQKNPVSYSEKPYTYSYKDSSLMIGDMKYSCSVCDNGMILVIQTEHGTLYSVYCRA